MGFARARVGDRMRKIRYAVVGLGHIAQAAVLPAFDHARENSALVALVSDDAEKRRILGLRHGVKRTLGYEGYERLLGEGAVDAVYIALPNPLHREYAVKAACAGVHVLCEKPMALTEQDGQAMVRAVREAGVKLMVAYRLHFEEANLSSIEAIRRGKIGDPRIFMSTFTMQVGEGNIRLQPEGGGPLYDLGIYCVNAARYLFRDEPVEVVALAGNSGDPRFKGVLESVSGLLRFPQGRLAGFACSAGASDVGEYRVVGTRGDLRLDPAYEYAGKLRRVLTSGGRTERSTFARRDQFAAELIYFSDCILEDREPEPSGQEGLEDIRILQALEQSIRMGQAVRLDPEPPAARPGMAQEIRRPPARPSRPIHARSPRKRA